MTNLDNLKTAIAGTAHRMGIDFSTRCLDRLDNALAASHAEGIKEGGAAMLESLGKAGIISWGDVANFARTNRDAIRREANRKAESEAQAFVPGSAHKESDK